jgi:hypothetical protein
MSFFSKTVQQATMVCIAYEAFWVTENKQLTAASTFTPAYETATFKDNLKQDRQCAYNVILRRFLPTTAAAEKR